MKLRILFIALCLLSCQYSFSQKITALGLKSINGTKLFCKVMGTGEPILVIHGGPGFPHDYFLPYLETLAKTNKLIFYDQRATGLSAIPNDTIGASHKNMVNDIEAIRKAFGITKLNILAHSWGAKLAVAYALKYPAALRSMVLSNSIPLNHDYDSIQNAVSTSRIYDPGFKEKKEEIQNRQITIIEIKMRFAFLATMYNPANVDSVKIAYPKDYGDKQRALFKGLGHDYLAYDDDYYPKLKQIKCPVLVIHGDADAVPLAASERLATSLLNGKLQRMDKSGHFPFIEERERYAEIVHSFIATPK